MIVVGRIYCYSIFMDISFAGYSYIMTFTWCTIVHDNDLMTSSCIYNLFNLANTINIWMYVVWFNFINRFNFQVV